VATSAAQSGLSLNDVDFVAAPGDDAADRLLGGELAAAWVDQPAWTRVADADGFALAVTLPTTESIDGTMLAARLLGAERDVGLAYARAEIRSGTTGRLQDAMIEIGAVGYERPLPGAS
jgi:hypothetical protein